LLDRVRRDAAEPELQESYRRLASIQLAASSAELDDDGLGEIVAQGVRELSSPWFRYFLEHDPRPVLRELRVPVLALNGEIDLQVDPDQNLPAIREALAKGSSPDVTVKEMPGLNHLFQKAATGAVDEYGAIEETINPTVLETVATWILERFGHDSESERSGTG
jgi:hypothetical protein